MVLCMYVCMYVCTDVQMSSHHKTEARTQSALPTGAGINHLEGAGAIDMMDRHASPSSMEEGRQRRKTRLALRNVEGE